MLEAVAINAALAVLSLLIFTAQFASALVSLDIVSLAAVWFICKTFPRRSCLQQPDISYLHEDEYPIVAVHLPIYNEGTVAGNAIDCSCRLDWPRNKLIIQVLDDSTDDESQRFVDDKVLEWAAKGVNIQCERRTSRFRYKAGAMEEGMKYLNKQGVEYIAVFDADFKPTSSFLKNTVPHMMDDTNSEIGFVQALWTYNNASQSLLTKTQEIYLNFHLGCEQVALYYEDRFFNFNGGGGVWRAECVEHSGGWSQCDTTTEDLELSIKSYLAGWRGIFLDNITVPTELPTELAALNTQQHRWKAGHTKLAVEIALPIAKASQLSLYTRVELIFRYWLSTRVLKDLFMTGFVPVCLVLPVCLLVGDDNFMVPTWCWLWQPVIVSLIKCSFTPNNGWMYTPIFILWSNSSGVVKLWGTLAGLFGLSAANNWVVTTKSGGSSSDPLLHSNTRKRFHVMELGMSFFLLLAGMVGILRNFHVCASSLVLLNGFTCLGFGLGLVG